MNVTDLAIRRLSEAFLCGHDPQPGTQEMDLIFPADKRRHIPESKRRVMVRVTPEMLTRAEEIARRIG